MTRSYIFFITFILLTSSSLSFAEGVQEEFGTWGFAAFSGSAKLFGKALGLDDETASKFHWSIMGMTRNRDDSFLSNPNAGASMNPRQELFWSSLGYSITPNASFWFGYSQYWDLLPNGKHDSVSRPYQDFLYTTHIGGGFTFTSRSRLEELFTVSGYDATGTTLGDIGIRFRQLFGISHAIPGTKNVSIYLSDELWEYLNSWGVNGDQNLAGFNQNHLALGFNFRINSNANVTLGYLGNYIHNTAPRSPDLMIHNLQLGFTYNFN
ncbi:DUF2490 domain-containing protein [Candidatus Nitrosacidococcus sp. I8]|uniref:DUF2490 domain-containing protein n=1 Tax=Candidatus Nitrosacidococcus sp. I8 TaxID=2942908 RepID=UPI0022262CF2|nr:DUF2490 domain-containing protein [Candidatus Nitrosacidococcus sp. I8]CAH9018197.1 hypothetical protein NURINAE_00786 [Candidatus Nitrosacidococcus sp. I8]